MDVSSIDPQGSSEMGKLEGIFSALSMLFQVPGQAAVAVGRGPERGLNAPAERERVEALSLGWT